MKNIIFLTLVTLVFGCAHKKKLDPNVAKVSRQGIISVTARWVKDKGDKFDLNLVVENLRDEGIIVYLKDIRCQRGNQGGRLKHTFFNTGERTIDFASGEIKDFNMVCDHYQKAKGPFKINITKVYSNPENDGETRGKVIAEDVEWETAEF